MFDSADAMLGLEKPILDEKRTFHSDRALLVFLLLSFIIKNTRAYEVMQKRAVIPVYFTMLES